VKAGSKCSFTIRKLRFFYLISLCLVIARYLSQSFPNLNFSCSTGKLSATTVQSRDHLSQSDL
jgi:hypothetical protein